MQQFSNYVVEIAFHSNYLKNGNFLCFMDFYLQFVFSNKILPYKFMCQYYF